MHFKVIIAKVRLPLRFLNTLLKDGYQHQSSLPSNSVIMEIKTGNDL